MNQVESAPSHRPIEPRATVNYSVLMNVDEYPDETKPPVLPCNSSVDPAPFDPETKAKVSLKEVLDNFSKYRIRQVAIRVTAKPNGSGRNAEVVRASFKRRRRARSKRVAVKKLRFGGNMDKEKFSKEFVHEVKMLAGLCHPNIVRLVGFVEDLERDKAWIVLSWEPNGNIHEFISSGEWEIPERISLIKDIFDGIKYLHTRKQPIRHGDLKSLNILVSSFYRAIITDFGSSRALGHVKNGAKNQHTVEGSNPAKSPLETTSCPEVRIVATATQLTLTGPAWSLRWAAPEVLNANDDLDLSSDIWSGGWVCWEVMTGKLPFSEINSEARLALEIVKEIDRLIPENTELGHVIALCSLMADCWKFDPSHRPDIKQCYDRVKWMPSVTPLGGASSRAKASSTALKLAMGYMHYLKSDYGTALLRYQQALASAAAVDDELTQAQALEGLGDVYRGLSKYLEAEGCYQQAQKLYIQVEDNQGRANTLRGLGDAYHCQSQYREAKECYTRAQVIYTRIGDDHGLANTLRGLGDVYRGQSKYFEAEGCYTQAREIYIRTGDDQGKAHALRGMGDLSYVQSRYPEAERRYTEARGICIGIGDDQGRAHTLRGLGDVYYVQCKYPEAEECYTQAREISIRVGDGQGLGNTLLGLGDVYYVQSKYPDAEGCYNEAQGIYVRIGDDQGRANTFRALGDAYRVQLEYPKAEGCYLQAQGIYLDIGDDQGRANTLLGLGHVYRARGQSGYLMAEEHYTGARDIYTQIGDDQGRANTLRGLGDVHLGQSQFAEAEQCYTEALDIYKRIGNGQGWANTLRSLGHLSRQRCRNTEAAKFYTEAKKLYARTGNRGDEKDSFTWLAVVSAEQSPSQPVQNPPVPSL